MLRSKAMSTHYLIVGQEFNGQKPPHEDLSEKVNSKLKEGYNLLGAPFFGEEMMYQAMTIEVREHAGTPLMPRKT